MPFVCHAASSCCYTADTGMQIRLRYRRSAPGTPAVTNSGPSLREARVGDGGGDGPTQPPSSQHKRETCPSRRSTGRGRGSDRCATKAADHRAACRVAGGRSDRSAAASTYGAARHRSLARGSAVRTAMRCTIQVPAYHPGAGVCGNGLASQRVTCGRPAAGASSRHAARETGLRVEVWSVCLERERR